jgi:hypothetical protein
MNEQITSSDIKNNTFFWYFYISIFRGSDEEKEINIDEVLEVIDVNTDELVEWQKKFFPNNDSQEMVRFIGGRLNDKMTFHIEFQEDEILYFLNDIYIGNLGGHFEAWFLTFDELVKFAKYDSLFLLLLPMTAIEKTQVETAKKLITEHLVVIPKFEKEAKYIAECILNGLLIEENFYIHEIGIANNQNHSVRNIEEYPRYKEDIRELNLALAKFIE